MAIEYELVTDAARLGPIANEVLETKIAGIDLETTGLNPRDGVIRLLQLNTGKGVYVIDVFQTKTLGPVVEALADPSVIKIIQNGKFEQKWFKFHLGIELWPLFDTFRASALLYNGMDGEANDLYSIYARELNLHPEVPDAGGSNWGNPILSKLQYDYAAEDVVHLLKLRDVMKPKLAAEGLNKIALIEFAATIPEAEIELNGFFLDKDSWLELAEQNKIAARRLQDELLREMPHPEGQLALPGMASGFNLNSTSQVLESFRRLGVKVYDSESKKMVLLPDTKEMTLAMVAGTYKQVEKLLEYRGYATKLKSFGPKYLRHIHPKTGRIHGEFYPFTGAGRYSMNSPNLQQIPRDAEFRKCFKAPPGKKLLVCDYKNIEMCIVGEIANDKVLIRLFNENKDAHYHTASVVLDKQESEVTKKERQKAKPVNFGFIYGMMPKKLVLYAMANYGVAMTFEEASKFRKKFFAEYSGVDRWHRDVQGTQMKKGSTRTIGGRRRFLAEDAFNEWYNSPVQGTGADGLKAALFAVHKKLKKYGDRAKMVHMVHDEIVLEVDDDPEVLKGAQHDLEAGMLEGMQPFLKKIPVVADASSGDSWADKA